MDSRRQYLLTAVAALLLAPVQVGAWAPPVPPDHGMESPEKAAEGLVRAYLDRDFELFEQVRQHLFCEGKTDPERFYETFLENTLVTSLEGRPLEAGQRLSKARIESSRQVEIPEPESEEELVYWRHWRLLDAGLPVTARLVVVDVSLIDEDENHYVVRLQTGDRAPGRWIAFPRYYPRRLRYDLVEAAARPVGEKGANADSPNAVVEPSPTS